MTPQADSLFEVSWEVCNKVGGIYTVVASKAEHLTKLYDNYILIGPYVKEKALIDFEPMQAPEWIQKSIDQLNTLGVTAHFGKWIIKGSPCCILLDFWNAQNNLNQLKSDLWNKFKVDSLGAQYDFDEPLLFSYASALLIHELTKHKESKISVAHFHEWMTGLGLLILKLLNNKTPTIFTTHATMLGRAICGNGEDLYAILDHIDPYRRAQDLQILPKFTAEKACAHSAEVFTTVSEITALEAEKILGIKPHLLTLNGLAGEQFPSFEDIAIKHTFSKKRFKEFLSYAFFPYYQFDLDQTLVYFTMGRYEYRNKGTDLTIRALAKLNEQLKQSNSKKNVAFFFFIPMQAYGVKKEIIENKVLFRNINNFVERNFDSIKDDLTKQIATNSVMETCDILSDEFAQAAKKLYASFNRKNDVAPLCTHYIDDEEQNPIIQTCKTNGLLNRKEDKVKVILYPVYLNGVDGLLDLDYYDTILGGHLGLFPSYYEPWGYTPQETATLGVAAVTSDLAGFGRYMKAQHTKEYAEGIYVLKRHQNNDDQAVQEYADMLFNYANYSHNQRVENKIAAKHMSKLADWSTLVDFYIQAHNTAIKNGSD